MMIKREKKRKRQKKKKFPWARKKKNTFQWGFFCLYWDLMICREATKKCQSALGDVFFLFAHIKSLSRTITRSLGLFFFLKP